MKFLCGFCGEKDSVVYAEENRWACKKCEAQINKEEAKRDALWKKRQEARERARVDL